MIHFIFFCLIMYYLVSCLNGCDQKKTNITVNHDNEPTTYKDIPSNLFQ